MKTHLVLAIINIVLVLFIAVFAVKNFIDKEILSGIIDTVIVAVGCGYSFSHFKEYKKLKSSDAKVQK